MFQITLRLWQTIKRESNTQGSFNSPVGFSNAVHSVNTVLMWQRDSSKKILLPVIFKAEMEGLNCKHALFLTYQSLLFLSPSQGKSGTSMWLVFTTARMRHVAGVKHILRDKALHVLISSLPLYSSKCTGSINSTVLEDWFPLEFAIQSQMIWLTCRNPYRCQPSIFPRLLVLNQNQSRVIAIHSMFLSPSDEKNITMEIFLIYPNSIYCILLFQQSHREVLWTSHSTHWHNPEVLGPATYVFF